MDTSDCRLMITFNDALQHYPSKQKLRQYISNYERNWLEHFDYYKTIQGKKNYNYIKMRNFLKSQYRHTDYFHLEDEIYLDKDRDVYRKILVLWKKLYEIVIIFNDLVER